MKGYSQNRCEIEMLFLNYKRKGLPIQELLNHLPEPAAQVQTDAAANAGQKIAGHNAYFFPDFPAYQSKDGNQNKCHHLLQEQSSCFRLYFQSNIITEYHENTINFSAKALRPRNYETY